MFGLTFPGCPETYQTQQQSSRCRDSRRGEQGGQQKNMDQLQKLRGIRQGDIIAIPAGAAHWCHNDGNEELVMVAVFHLNNQDNQLDQNFRYFSLAGGQASSTGKRKPYIRQTGRSPTTGWFTSPMVRHKYKIVGNTGETIMDERVKNGDMFVIPQFYAVTTRAETMAI
ncbi:hypothetical protein REPUB_Repub17cG0078500 [Reevesia pubescens]